MSVIKRYSIGGERYSIAVPSFVNYIAMDRNCKIWAYRDKPEVGASEWLVRPSLASLFHSRRHEYRVNDSGTNWAFYGIKWQSTCRKLTA